MSEQSSEPASITANPLPTSGGVSDAHNASTASTPPHADPALQDTRKPSRVWKLLAGVVLGVGALALLLGFGIPWVELLLNTVSTDDAFVNGHVTFVAPRVAGQIARVLVDDNNRVRQGDLIAELDKEPYQVVVSQKQAAVDTAQADLQAATAGARAIEAQTRSRRWNLQRAVQDVDNQVALLQARIAAVDKSRAALALAHLQFDRARQLIPKADVSYEVYDQRQAQLTTAGAELAQSLAEMNQVRVSLGLPTAPSGDGDPGQVPPDLDETFSSVLEAQAELVQSAAQLGVVHSFDQGPKAMLGQFEELGDIDKTFERYEADAPAVRQAEAKLAAAKRDLDQAELNLRYCDIVAQIDGVVTRRSVNPGNYVQVGQNLMAIRSLSEIWVDPNFKETQLGGLRIGLPVDLSVDMYGGAHSFKGRVAGFTQGTGSTLALLPPENATGNFVKVVQRLPVRIDLLDYDPDRTPLFIGTSVTPSVRTHEPPTGPDAGRFLQTAMTASALGAKP